MSREGRKRWGFFGKPFFIGADNPAGPMMKRLRMLQTPWGGIYLHFIYREDLDPVPHDHPWNFLRIVLRGGYVERFYEWPQYLAFDPQHLAADGHGGQFEQKIRRFKPSLVRTHSAHRIISVKPKTVSLVIVGPKVRVWGFWSLTDSDVRWTDYRDALGLRPTEGVV